MVLVLNSLRVLSGISTLAEVNFLNTKPIRVSKLLAHDDESRPMFPTNLLQ